MGEKDLSRVPQTLTFDTDALYKAYGEESTIIRDILVYVANAQLKDLWGNVSFTIDDFCRELGYNRTTLQRTLEQFKETKKNLPIIDGHLYDSTFEYALYRAMKENITFTRKRENGETVEVYNLIDKLDIDYDKTTKKTTKRRYTLKLGEKIMDNLFKEYFLIDFFEYKNLKSAKLSSLGAFRNFYVFMARMIAQVQFNRKKNVSEEYTISIDNLCIILNSTAELPKHKKLYVKRTLETIQENLPNTKFSWTFTPENSKIKAYYVSFHFQNETIEYFNERLKGIFLKKLIAECESIYLRRDNKVHENYQDIIRDFKNINKKDFYSWLVNGADLDIKIRKFKEVYESVYRSVYPYAEINFECLPIA